MSLVANFDGGARGNPGPAGAGVVIAPPEGEPIFEAGYFLGRQTNNAAEYLALLRALDRLANCAADRIELRSDSELLVRQITGEYRVKSPALAELHEQAQRKLLRLPRWSIRHVPRALNQRADELANMAMDAKADIVVRDIDRGADVAPLAEITPPDIAPPDAGGRPRESARRPDRSTADQPPRSTDEPAPGERLVQLTLARRPKPGGCPAADQLPQHLVIADTLPAGLCVHAAHAVITTVLAIKNAAADEFFAVPTLTVRCARPECNAEFHVAPLRGPNGRKP